MGRDKDLCLAPPRQFHVCNMDCYSLAAAPFPRMCDVLQEHTLFFALSTLVEILIP